MSQQPPPRTTTVVHASLGSLSQGSSFASSGGSCCSSSRSTLVDGPTLARQDGLQLAEDSVAVGAEASASLLCFSLGLLFKESSDSVAPLKSARPGPKPVVESPLGRALQNGFYRTTTISVLNGAGLLSLGPEQKSRSLCNLDGRPQPAVAAAGNGNNGTIPQRSVSPAPSKASASAEAVTLPRLQKYKYGTASQAWHLHSHTLCRFT